MMWWRLQADGIFRRMLALQDKADLHATDVMRAARWKKVEPLAKSYIGNTIHLLGAQPASRPSHSLALWNSHLRGCVNATRECLLALRRYLVGAGQMTEPAMLSFVLRRARASVPIMGGADKLQRRLQKAALAVFGSADSGPRVQAALLVRAMALLLPAPALDNVLKVRNLTVAFTQCSPLQRAATAHLLD